MSMKGIIFNEFLNFVEKSESYTLVDQIIMDSHLKSNGAYTSIGTYSPEELFQLVKALAMKNGKPTSMILQEYGEYLFEVFAKKYPQFFREKKSVFQFLEALETHIHFEVKKLYDHTELPHFECQYHSQKQMEMIYTSSRPLADFAEGLIRGCIKYHKENMTIVRENLPAKTGFKVRFVLTKGDPDE
ncbi:TPA: guanylate cyclase [Legionella pneumophila subsp. pneumophila]|nr:guanylate cyclase [Legionella pneumophila]HAT8821306.1 guanylate cyclase [Legionella pneumophila subsp. pneumophila]RYX23855.1 guanylate cyclase [Legionella pneumophila]RYX29035.1 guanylate cyclase [Legionella pneumophila]RYX35155.1 guanylate cyclase [Legionella pneumophila]